MTKNADRNEEIWRKRTEQNRTFDSLGKEYGLTRERIRQIVKSVDRKHAHKIAQESSLRWRFVDEFFPLVSNRSQTAMSLIGIFNALLYHGFATSDRYTQSPKSFLEWFMACDIGNFIDVKNLGPERITICIKIQDQIKNTPSLKDKLLDGCKTIY